MNQGLFFNSSDKRFKYWDAAREVYVVVSDLVIGDVKHSLVPTDDPEFGWAKLDGRPISELYQFTDVQKAALESLFPTGFLPFVAFIVGGPPSFPDLQSPGVYFPTGAQFVDSLPIGATYDQEEIEDLRGNVPSGPTGASGASAASGVSGPTEPNGFAGLAQGFHWFRDKAEFDAAATREALHGRFAFLQEACAKIYCGPRGDG